MKWFIVAVLVILFCGCAEHIRPADITFLHMGVLSQDKNGQYYFAWVEGKEIYAIPIIQGLIPEYRKEE
jgi:hypothetical protein